MIPVAIARAIVKNARIKPNKSELRLEGILNTYFPSKWVRNGGQIIIEGTVPDFFCIDGYRAIIELVGRPDVPKHSPEALEKRRKMYAKYGFRMLVIHYKDLPRNEAEEEGFTDDILIWLLRKG